MHVSLKWLVGALAACCLMVSGTLSAQEEAPATEGHEGHEGWLIDFEEAKQTAENENKDLLIEFTGSDWCPPCKQLYANVISNDIFKQQAPEHFTLLLLDNPRDKSHQSEEEQAQYRRLAAEYQVRGVPTILLCDTEGVPYASMVGYGGTAAQGLRCGGVWGSSIGGSGGHIRSTGTFPPSAGATNTGSGGGGQVNNTFATGGAGGSGVVIIRYRASSAMASGGSFSCGGGWCVHRFTSGTANFTTNS